MIFCVRPVLDDHCVFASRNFVAVASALHVQRWVCEGALSEQTLRSGYDPYPSPVVVSRVLLSFVLSSLLKDGTRQARVIELDRKVKEAVAKAAKAKGPPKDPEGFLEGALLNKDVAAAHDKFMADIEVRPGGEVGLAVWSCLG